MSSNTDLVLVADPALQQHQGPHPVDVYLAARAAGSRPTLLSALNILAELLGVPPTTQQRLDGHGQPRAVRATAYACAWHQVRYAHAAALRAAVAERYAPATANKLLTALRGILETCWQLHLLSAEEYHTARSVKAIRGERVPKGRALTSGELLALLETCALDPTPAGRRDAALLALLYACGLRRAEVAALQLADYDPQEQALKILGKGNKQRYAYVVDAGGQAALADWLAVRGTWPGPLFSRILMSGVVLRQGLSTAAIYARLQRRAETARVPHLAPHDFRRTFVGDLLDAGVDLSTVQRMAGHANVETTAKYDRRPEQAKKRAAGVLRVPYRRAR